MSHIDISNTNEIKVAPCELRIPLDYDARTGTSTLVRLHGNTRDELPASGILADGQYYLSHQQNWDSGVYHLQGVVTVGTTFCDYTKIYTLRIK